MQKDQEVAENQARRDSDAAQQRKDQRTERERRLREEKKRGPLSPLAQGLPQSPGEALGSPDSSLNKSFVSWGSSSPGDKTPRAPQSPHVSFAEAAQALGTPSQRRRSSAAAVDRATKATNKARWDKMCGEASRRAKSPGARSRSRSCRKEKPQTPKQKREQQQKAQAARAAVDEEAAKAAEALRAQFEEMGKQRAAREEERKRQAECDAASYQRQRQQAEREYNWAKEVMKAREAREREKERMAEQAKNFAEAKERADRLRPPPPAPAGPSREEMAARAQVTLVKAELASRMCQPVEMRKQHFKALLLHWHPDKNPDKAVATAVFQALQAEKATYLRA